MQRGCKGDAKLFRTSNRLENKKKFWAIAEMIFRLVGEKMR